MNVLLYRALYQNPQTKEGVPSVPADVRQKDGTWQCISRLLDHLKECLQRGSPCEITVSFTRGAGPSTALHENRI